MYIITPLLPFPPSYIPLEASRSGYRASFVKDGEEAGLLLLLQLLLPPRSPYSPSLAASVHGLNSAYLGEYRQSPG